MIFRKVPYTSQPQTPTKLNPDRAKGVTYFFPLNGSPIELVTGAMLTYGSGKSTAVDSRGLSLQGSGAAACASIPLQLSAYTKASVSFWLYWPAFANDDKFAMEYGTTNNIVGSGFVIDPNSGGSSSGLFMTGVGGTVNSNAVSFTRPSVGWHHYLFNFDRTTGTSKSTAVWVDGVSQTTAAVGSPGDVTDAFGNSTLYLLSRNNTSLYGDGRLQNLTIRGGYLSTQRDVDLEYRDPWGIFAPQTRNIFVSVAAGDVSAALTGQSTTVSFGTVSAAITAPLTGQSVSVELGTMTAVVGGVSLELTGQSVSISLGSVLSDITAPLTGQSVTAEQGTVTASVGGVEAALTGQSLSIALGSVLSAVTAPLTGQSLTIAQGTVSVAGTVTTATTLVITKITGTFAAGSIKVGATTVGTCTGAQVINGASTALLRAQYTNLAADVYRALIAAVPGSGSILGVWMYNDVVYAFRNAADGLTAAMYKSTTSGWSLVALGRELSYISGGGAYSPAVGDTITGETSAATAIITAITVQSGTLAGGDATGRIIFASQTGTFQAETIKVGANLNVANIAGNSTAITFAVPGGRFEFGNYNFGTTKMYGVDGKNRGFEFDGTTFVPIATGMTTDTPTFLREHKNHLFYAFSGSAQHSGIGTPYTWTIVSGASELAMGDTITGFQRQVGSQTTATLVIFTRNGMKMLYGTSSSSWVLVSYKEEAGAYPYTTQQIGLTLMLDDRGVTSLETSQNYGNFMDSTLTKHIQTWINARRSISIASCVVRDKNQYRLFFTDGSALYITMDNGKPVGMMPILLTNIPTCICSLENNSGNERIYFGDSSGYVYQMDAGTSFDGSDIEFYMDFAYNNFGSPRVLKSFKSAVLEVAGDGYGEFGFGSSLGYASTEISQPSTQTTALSLTAPSWDVNFTWDVSVWDGVSLLPSYFSMQGDSENISIKILGSSDYYSPLRFSGVLVNYVVRRAMR
jgi:hypothetical protein